jgi:MarR family transcriptional regulator for hemolysin
MSEDRNATEQALVTLLNQLHRSYRRLLDRALAADGLSAAQALPVIFISRHGDGIRQGVLAEQLGIEGPSLVRQLDQLQEAGLVERRDDPKDRRAKGLYLTAAGRDLAGRTETLLTSLRSGVLTNVSDDELQTTLRVLREFEQAVLSALGQPTSSGTD